MSSITSLAVENKTVSRMIHTCLYMIVSTQRRCLGGKCVAVSVGVWVVSVLQSLLAHAQRKLVYPICEVVVLVVRGVP